MVAGSNGAALIIRRIGFPVGVNGTFGCDSPGHLLSRPAGDKVEVYACEAMHSLCTAFDEFIENQAPGIAMIRPRIDKPSTLANRMSFDNFHCRRK